MGVRKEIHGESEGAGVGGERELLCDAAGVLFLIFVFFLGGELDFYFIYCYPTIKFWL